MQNNKAMNLLIQCNHRLQLLACLRYKIIIFPYYNNIFDKVTTEQYVNFFVINKL